MTDITANASILTTLMNSSYESMFMMELLKIFKNAKCESFQDKLRAIKIGVLKFLVIVLINYYVKNSNTVLHNFYEYVLNKWLYRKITFTYKYNEKIIDYFIAKQFEIYLKMSFDNGGSQSININGFNLKVNKFAHGS